MDAEQLVALQRPLKTKYREDPESAVVTLRPDGLSSNGVRARVDVAEP